MNYFSQQRLLGWGLLAMLLLNLALLFLLWRNQAPKTQDMRIGPPQNHQSIKDRLGISDEQNRQFKASRDRQHKRRNLIMDTVQTKRLLLLDELMKSQPDEAHAEQIIQEISLLLTERERNTFAHLLETKNYCTPEQQKRLEGIFKMVLTDKAHPPGAGPRGPRGRRPPPRPRDQ